MIQLCHVEMKVTTLLKWKGNPSATIPGLVNRHLYFSVTLNSNKHTQYIQ